MSFPIIFALRAASPVYISQRYYGSLLVGCCVSPFNRSHQNRRPHRPLYFNFFCPLIHHPKQWAKVLPHAFRPFSNLLSKAPPPRRHHRSVGCPVSFLNGGHLLRQVLRPSLNLSMGAILVPQTKASNAARASLDAGRL